MDTTDMEKLRILTMWECGKSTSEIAKSVNKSARTVQRWLAHHKREGNMNKKPRGLRPRKTTPEEDEMIIQLVKENPGLTQQQILSLCNLNIYKGTLRRRIQEANGVYKIDLFPIPKEKKKGPYPKRKKKRTEEIILKMDTEEMLNMDEEEIMNMDEEEIMNMDEEVLNADVRILKTDTMEEQILTTDIMEEQVATEGNANSVEVETTLLENFINHGTMQDASGNVELKCLRYEEEEFQQQDEASEQHFHDVAYESGTEEDGFFEITESVQQRLSDDVFNKFISATARNVKVEIIESQQGEPMSDPLELPAVAEESFEEEASLLDEQEQETIVGIAVEEEILPMQVEEVHVKEEPPRRKRTRKPKLPILPDVEEPEPNVGQRDIKKEVMIPPKPRKRRGRKEPSYTEELQEEEVQDEAKSKIKKRGRRKKSAAALGETKKERKKRMKKEQIQWEKDRKDTTDIEKKKILIMAECGMSTEDIARALKKSRRTVQRWLSKYNKGLDMERKERGKRPRKTTPEEDARIVQIVKENPHLSRKEILQQANINLHKVTLKSRLNEAGMYFNSQGVKILDFTDNEALSDHSGRISSPVSSNDLVTSPTIINTLTNITTSNNIMLENSANTTTTLANGIITCPTISTTLIIANPIETTIGTNTVLTHLTAVPTLVYSPSPTVANFHDYTLYQ